MKKQNYILVIGDRSGSMADKLTDAVGGYNSFIREQKKLDEDVFVTLVLFDDRYEVLYDKMSCKNIADLQTAQWGAVGSTALLDAMGKGISSFTDGLSTESIENSNFFVVIITDGEENSSREWNKDRIKRLISDKEMEGWNFIFLAKDMDAIHDAHTYGLSSGSTYTYDSSNASCYTMSFNAASYAIGSTITNGVFDTTKLEELSSKN